jgi:hypothetical protein
VVDRRVSPWNTDRARASYVTSGDVNIALIGDSAKGEEQEDSQGEGDDEPVAQSVDPPTSTAAERPARHAGLYRQRPAADLALPIPFDIFDGTTPDGRWKPVTRTSPRPTKLCRTFVTLLEALNRHHVKGQQRMTVEHFHVHSGGQAVVSVVESAGVGIAQNRRINPMQSRLPMHRSPRCSARTRSGSPCGSPAIPNGRCQLHGDLSPGVPQGN